MGIDSESFVDVLHGKKKVRKNPLYWEFYEKGSAQAVRFGKWKAIRQPMFTGKVELYDISNDPGEKADYAQRRLDLARHAVSLMEKMHEPDLNWKVRGKRKK